MNDDHTFAPEMTAEEAIQMVLKRPEMYGLQKVASRQPSENDREAVTGNELADAVRVYHKVSGKPANSEGIRAVLALSRAAVPDAATELAAIKARADEVGEDEGWHIGGAWGDYGEVVVPLRILSYVVDGALDEKIVSTDPGYAATYAEQVARADRAEAERDAALARIAELEAEIKTRTEGFDEVLAGREASPEEWRLIERDEAHARIAEAAKLHQPQPGQGVRYCADCDQRWPCPTAVSLGLNEGESTDD